MAPQTEPAAFMGKQYGITYTARTKEDFDSIKIKQGNDGTITIWGKKSDFYLPDNAATSIVFKGSESRIIDGKETDGKKYKDDIQLQGKRNEYFTSGSKNGADIIQMQGDTNLACLMGQGNTVAITKDAKLPMIYEQGKGNTVMANDDVDKNQLSLRLTPNDPKLEYKKRAINDLMNGDLARKEDAAYRPYYEQRTHKNMYYGELRSTYLPDKVAGDTQMIVESFGFPGNRNTYKVGASTYDYTPEGTAKLDEYLLTKTKQ